MQVQDLNAERTLPFESNTLAAVTIALSIQYLSYPEQVINEIGRVLEPGGTLIISFSNRMFPSKAIYAWRSRSEVCVGGQGDHSLGGGRGQMLRVSGLCVCGATEGELPEFELVLTKIEVFLVVVVCSCV